MPGIRTAGDVAYSSTPIHQAKMPDPHVQGYLYGTNVQSLNAYVAAVTGDFLNSGIQVKDGEKPFLGARNQSGLKTKPTRRHRLPGKCR
jgi:hypothetical protein